MEFKHISILLNETIENLDIKPEGIYVDGTFGRRWTCLACMQSLEWKGTPDWN